MILKPLNQCNILVTPTSFAKYNKDYKHMLENTVKKVIYNTTGKPLTEKDLIPLVTDIDGFIAGLDNITSKVINTAKELKVISRYGTGINNLDLNAAKDANIFVTNTPGANSVSVAEITIGLAIATARDIVNANIRMKMGDWPRLSGISLSGKKFGIIGLGNIGKEVAKRLSCFDIEILAYDIDFDSSFAKKYNILYSDLDVILKSSDFISLHIPAVKETLSIINKKTLAKMKKGAIFINTARGELVDEDALYKSIKNGHLRAAGLDAFKEEPPNRNNKLLSLPQIITTSHIGAATDNASNEMTRISIEECLSVLRGEKPKNIVISPDE